jgi:hypothetical protein
MMMTRLIFPFLVCGMLCHGQDSEFKVHDNGLIYSSQAVSKLKHIVDSLNLKFKQCDASKKFVSVEQCKAHFIRLENKQSRGAKKDIEAGISYADFKQKYPNAKYDENLVVTKDYSQWDGRELYSVRSMGFGDRGHSLNSDETRNTADFQKPFKGKWIVYHHERIGDWPEAVEAFYFPEEFSSKPIPTKYAQQIQYADCLVDTTAQVFRAHAVESGVRYYDSIPGKARLFNEYVDKVLKRPDFGQDRFEILIGLDTADYGQKRKKMTKKELAVREAKQKTVEAEFHDFQQRMQVWKSLRLQRIDSLKFNDPGFLPMFAEAYAEAQSKHNSDDEFEQYVGLFISKEAELELKRNRRVIGGCSMDFSPREHAFNIALLSAETIKWEIFLRSHLDIMNDNFSRVSDGSYAQAGRQTYIKELETLEINVPDLLLGISLRIDNPAQNHYFSSVSRIGRAIAESKDAKIFEEALLNMIADATLDDYNRVVMYYLFDNYNYSVTDASVKAANIERLKSAVAKMPDYIASRITFAAH